MISIAKFVVRRVLERSRRAFQNVEVTVGEDPSVQVLQGVKLYRDVRIGDTVFRGSADSPGRSINYVFDLLPEGALVDKEVLDVGTAGGAVCFEAVRRGSRRAVGVETDERRLRGARFIKRRARVQNVQFVQQDFWEFLRGRQREFDVVFVLNVLQHLASPYPMLRRIGKAARTHIVIETPDEFNFEQFAEYRATLPDVEAAGPAKSPEDFSRYLAMYDFVLERQHPSDPEIRFFRGQESPRSVYVYSRRPALPPKSREERLLEMAVYRHARTDSYERARADAFNIDVTPEADLTDVMREAFSGEWAAARLNVLIAGPRASGKSHYFERIAAEFRPAYNSKVFKFPNENNQQGLRRHLNPQPGQGGKFAEVMISTVDDEYAHCTNRELGDAIVQRPVVCLLLNVSFDEHFDRLYRRYVERAGHDDSDVDFDASLRFDCTRFIDELKKRGCHYRVLTPTPRA